MENSCREDGVCAITAQDKAWRSSSHKTGYLDVAVVGWIEMSCWWFESDWDYRVSFPLFSSDRRDI